MSSYTSCKQRHTLRQDLRRCGQKPPLWVSMHISWGIKIIEYISQRNMRNIFVCLFVFFTFEIVFVFQVILILYVKNIIYILSILFSRLFFKYLNEKKNQFANNFFFLEKL